MKIVHTIKTTGVICLFIILAAACSKSDDNPSPSGNNNGGNTPTPSWADTISRKWKVVAATHKGSPDNSSKGLELDIRKNGSYTLISTGYVGTWKFTDNTYKAILLDENEAQFKTTWTVVKLTAKRLEVDFKSPFTGGASHWDMEPF
jgi:hypothetical protein